MGKQWEWFDKLEITDRLRGQIRANFTITRDGYTCWYKGAPRFVCGKGADPAKVQETWEAKRKAIDGAKPQANPDVRLYREVLSAFLDRQQARVGAKVDPISERTVHNYEEILNDFGNFTIGGLKIANMAIRDIGPEHFSAYRKKYADYKPSGFDSIVTRIGALFRWAVEMEFIDRYRPGPDFQRPRKQDIRDARIDKTFSFTPAEIAKAFNGANQTMKCWIALGVCAGFINSDIGNVPRILIDLKTGVIDFRRRKRGKIRRVIPLPADVVELLKGYSRPDPAGAEYADLFFLSENGLPYTRTRNSSGKPSCSVSRLTAKLLDDVGLKLHGRNFKGFRTSFYNLAPRSGYEIERKIIMGRAQGTVDLDSYLEDVGLDRLRHVVNHVWDQISTARAGLVSKLQAKAG